MKWRAEMRAEGFAESESESKEGCGSSYALNIQLPVNIVSDSKSLGVLLKILVTHCGWHRKLFPWYDK